MNHLPEIFSGIAGLCFLILIVIVSIYWLLFPFVVTSSVRKLHAETLKTNKLQERTNQLLEWIGNKDAVASSPVIASRPTPAAGTLIFNPGTYYFSTSPERVEGPFNAQKMEKFFKQGVLTWETPVREERDEEWGTIGNYVIA